jgi:hypothetical protein
VQRRLLVMLVDKFWDICMLIESLIMATVIPSSALLFPSIYSLLL